MFEPSPEILKELKSEQDMLLKIYQGKSFEEMTKFPEFKFQGFPSLRLQYSI